MQSSIPDLHLAAQAFQVRRVLSAMTDEQIERGLTAFIDGRSGSWASCFFARALGKNLMQVGLEPLVLVAKTLHIDEDAVQLVINMFDERNTWMTKQDLRRFIEQARDERQDSREVEKLLASIPQVRLTAKPVLEFCGA